MPTDTPTPPIEPNNVPASKPPSQIEVRRISKDDLIDAVAAGVRDFRAAPSYGLFFGLFYALGGWAILLLLWQFNLPYLAYPMAMGFALIAPFVVVGLYAVSLAREKGEPLSWSSVLGAIRGSSRRDLRWMALITAFAFVIWMDIAALSSFAFLNFRALTPDLVNELFTTPAGLLFLLIGNTLGALIAFGIFSISLTSFPMLFERDLDFVTAMTTSVRAVAANPVLMAVWCLTIAILVFISIASAFVGLLVVLPVLGHASWHLYRKLIPAPAKV